MSQLEQTDEKIIQDHFGDTEGIFTITEAP
jgi:hypothetical protein